MLQKIVIVLMFDLRCRINRVIYFIYKDDLICYSVKKIDEIMNVNALLNKIKKGWKSKMNLTNKKELRKEILARRNALSLQERAEKSTQIASKVTSLAEFQKSNKTLLYAPIRSEVETDAIYLEARRLSKAVYYPRVLGNEMEFYLVDETTTLEQGSFGIREPKLESAKQLVPNTQDEIFVLMPGAVFDEAGNRIGYGGGYYDKYLEWLVGMVPAERICKVAVGFACQMVEKGRIVRETHDVQVDYIVTESQVVKLR